MGFRLEVVRRPVVPQLTRSERRSWQLHRHLSTLLTRSSFEGWRPMIERNLDRLGGSVNGQPHERNLEQWHQLVERGDLPGLHRVLTGLDRDRSRCAKSPLCPGFSLTSSAAKSCNWSADATGPVGARHPHGLPDHRSVRGHRCRLPVHPRHLPRAQLPAAATMSVEVDILPIADTNDETARLADLIEGVAGEFSPFEELHGFSIDGVDLETSVLPDGWRDRLVKVQNANTAAPSRRAAIHRLVSRQGGPLRRQALRLTREGPELRRRPARGKSRRRRRDRIAAADDSK